MTALNQDIGGAADPFVAGDSKTIRVSVTDAEADDFDLTDAEIRWQLFRYAGAAPLIIKSAPGDITLEEGDTPPILSILKVALLPADTEPLGAGEYRHECEVIKDGVAMTVLQGKLTLTGQYIPAA